MSRFTKAGGAANNARRHIQFSKLILFVFLVLLLLFFFAVPPCLPIAFVVEQLSPADSLSNWSRDGSVPPQMPL